MAAIDIRGVTKQFGQVVAVNDLSLEVPEGSIYGFIGPNGSGKTTSIRMILNIIRPDRGVIRVLGRDTTSPARDDVGYLPEERGLYKKMPVRTLLRYYGRLKGRSHADLDPVIDEWLDRLKLREWSDKRIDQLSKGMAQKVQFISAIVSRPTLLILDEPFSGLDPVNANVLRDAVLDLRQRGTTIVFSTHDMGTAERLCDRIFMIFRGRKVLDGTLDEIQARYGQDTVRVRVSGGSAALAGLPGITALNDHGNYQDLRLEGPPAAFLRLLVAKADVQHFEVTRPSLHDIFVRIAHPTEAELRDDAEAVAR